MPGQSSKRGANDSCDRSLPVYTLRMRDRHRKSDGPEPHTPARQTVRSLNQGTALAGRYQPADRPCWRTTKDQLIAPINRPDLTARHDHPRYPPSSRGVITASRAPRHSQMSTVARQRTVLVRPQGEVISEDDRAVSEQWRVIQETDCPRQRFREQSATTGWQKGLPCRNAAGTRCILSIQCGQPH